MVRSAAVIDTHQTPRTLLSFPQAPDQARFASEERTRERDSAPAGEFSFPPADCLPAQALLQQLWLLVRQMEIVDCLRSSFEGLVNATTRAPRGFRCSPKQRAAFARCVATFKQDEKLLTGLFHPVLQLYQLDLKSLFLLYVCER